MKSVCLGALVATASAGFLNQDDAFPPVKGYPEMTAEITQAKWKDNQITVAAKGTINMSVSHNGESNELTIQVSNMLAKAGERSWRTYLMHGTRFLAPSLPTSQASALSKRMISSSSFLMAVTDVVIVSSTEF